MNIIKELEKVRESLNGTIITTINRLIEGLENPDSFTETAETEMAIPLYADPYVFIGKKPAAVLFGEERVEVKSWCEVCGVILARCNENPKCHETLMYLRNKVVGKCRVILSDSPDGMTKPLKIVEELYVETHYGSQTLMYILCNRILDCTDFDYSGINIVIRGKR